MSAGHVSGLFSIAASSSTSSCRFIHLVYLSIFVSVYLLVYWLLGGIVGFMLLSTLFVVPPIKRRPLSSVGQFKVPANF